MQRTTKICPKCERLISKSNFIRHLNSCKGEHKSERTTLNCQYCGKLCKNKISLAQHERKCHKNPNHDTSIILNFNNFGRKAWNKGLTKQTDDRVNQQAISLMQHSQEFGNYWLGKKHSAETIAKMKITAGGLREHAGRGKKGSYKGYYCDSTYELVYIIYCLDHKIDLKRNTSIYFEYQHEGRTHKYFPDFIIDNEFIEIKGYRNELADLKQQAAINAGVKIKTLYKQDLQFAFDYVKQHYSYKKLTDLYE